MDRQVKKRLLTPITVYPYLGSVDGDDSYGPPITLKGYVLPKTATTIDRGGVSYTIKTIIYLDGLCKGLIKGSDDLESADVIRCPIQLIYPLQSLKTGCELLEVLI